MHNQNMVTQLQQEVLAPPAGSDEAVSHKLTPEALEFGPPDYICGSYLQFFNSGSDKPRR